MRDTVGALDEAELIAIVTAACPTRPSPEGPGDDAALLPAGPAGLPRVLTSDALVEGVHFLRAHPPRALGWKSLAVNLSDVAAMGAVPEAFTLAVALPPDLPLAYWRAFSEGLGAYAAMQGVHLAGGDTVRARGPLMLTICAWGETREPGGLLLRSGGAPGDVLMVMGPIGRAGHGLARWLAAPHDSAWAAASDMPDPERLEHQLQPTPPLWAGPWALAHGAHAGLDLSDGLAADLPRLAAASGVTLHVELDQLPDDDLIGHLDPRLRAAYGEDYGLAVLVPPAAAGHFSDQGFAAIGHAGAAAESAQPAAPRVLWRLGGSDVTVTPSFRHFA